jgi:hypothetical protein
MPRPKISVVINVDTRKGYLEGRTSIQPGTQGGVLSKDFLKDGIINKTKFFKGAELIVCVDKHEDIADEEWDFLVGGHHNTLIDVLIIKQHEESSSPKWLDYTILNAMAMATGEYIAHFDQDMFISAPDPEKVIDEWVQLLRHTKYQHICYPSAHSPHPVKDKDFEGEYFWASSRFHIFNRETLDYTEISKCLDSSEYLYDKYGKKTRQCPWLEHIFGIMAGWGNVYYPPIEYEKYMLFAWSQYYPGTLAKLSKMTYTQQMNYVMGSGGIMYPCDVRGLKI